MPGAALLLVALSFVLAVPLTLLARALGHRLSALDSAGVKGQVKAAVRRVPNTGGVAIFWSFALPLALALVLVRVRPDLVLRLAPGLEPHLPGLVGVAGKAWVMLGAALVLHVMGLIDDRRALPAIPKLTVMLGVALCACWLTDTRVLTMLDGPAHGAWLSLLLSTLWIVAITNAMNFLDNMDGLSPGVGAICAAAVGIATGRDARGQAAAARRTILQSVDVPGTNLVSHLVVVEFPPNGGNPRHTHPGVTTGLVMEGELVLTVDGVGAATLKPGDGLAIPHARPHIEQAGAAGCKVAVSFTVEKGQPLASPA